MKIKVSDIVGTNCLTLDDGNAIYRILLPALRDGNRVELDFIWVEFFASPFFNAAIGRLLKDFKSDQLNALIEFQNLSKLGENILRKVVDNAKRYYANPDAWKGVDDALEEWSADN